MMTFEPSYWLLLCTSTPPQFHKPKNEQQTIDTPIQTSSYIATTMKLLSIAQVFSAFAIVAAKPDNSNLRKLAEDKSTSECTDLGEVAAQSETYFFYITILKSLSNSIPRHH